MIAAGIGARPGFTAAKPPPNDLPRFGGKSLLQFLIEILQRHGIDALVLGVFNRRQEIERAHAEGLPRIPTAAGNHRAAPISDRDSVRAETHGP